ncbi:MAG: hypothetical protein AAFX06_06120 [Planctomycetota bacterium]
MPEFPKTRWSLIGTVVDEAPTGSRENMGELLKVYWEPMFAHLRYKGVSNEKAEDLIQDFMLEILSKDLLAIADPKKGKFRTLLLTALDRFAVSKHRHETAAKRSPGDIASLDAAEVDSTRAAGEAPSLVFDRAWAMDVLASALARMQEACEQEGNRARWEIFERRVLAPLLEDKDLPEYDALAEEFSLPNEKSAMNMLVTAKRQLGRVLRDVIREYVTRREDKDSFTEYVATKMNASGISGSMSLARQLSEQAVHRLVEDELQQLTRVLAQSRNMAVKHVSDASQTGDPKSVFWQRLTQGEGNSSSKLKVIFAVGAKAEPAEAVDYTELFQELLGMPVGEFSGDSTRVRSIRNCLLSSEPDLDELKVLSGWAQAERGSSESSTPKEVAEAILFSAIAVARSKLNDSLVEMETRTLADGLKWLGEQGWVGDALQSIAIAATEPS